MYDQTGENTQEHKIFREITLISNEFENHTHRYIDRSRLLKG